MTRTARSRSRGLATLVLTATLAVGVSACGGDEPDGTASTGSSSPTASESTSETASEPAESPTETPTETPTTEGQVIDIEISGDQVVPNGERVDVEAGEEVTLRVTSDAPGEIHVHSTPEQELAYRAGETELSLTIDQPGVVEVESHDLGLVIVQLEVR